jgi:hypothetical protein
MASLGLRQILLSSLTAILLIALKTSLLDPQGILDRRRGWRAALLHYILPKSSSDTLLTLLLGISGLAFGLWSALPERRQEELLIKWFYRLKQPSGTSFGIPN